MQSFGIRLIQFVQYWKICQPYARNLMIIVRIPIDCVIQNPTGVWQQIYMRAYAFATQSLRGCFYMHTCYFGPNSIWNNGCACVCVCVQVVINVSPTRGEEKNAIHYFRNNSSKLMNLQEFFNRFLGRLLSLIRMGLQIARWLYFTWFTKIMY